MQIVAERTLEALQNEKPLDCSSLMVFAESLMVNNLMLSDLLAKASMKFDETYAGQDPQWNSK